MSDAEQRELPTLRTERLVLRPFCLEDAATVQRLAGDARIADTTLNIPHPYEDGVAETWIGGQAEEFQKDVGVTLAVTLAASGELIGGIGLMAISRQHEHAELGYWIAVEHWGKGYCTEAARAVIRFGFDEFGLSRIHAHHFSRNPASGRVMLKAGMRREGVLRHHVKKGDRFEDLEVYGILKDDGAGTE